MAAHPNREPRRWGLVAGAVGILAALHVLPRFLEPPTLVENRELAAMPTWVEAQADGWGLPKKLDAYVQDRFPARAHLISGLNWLRMQIGDSGSSRVIVGRGTWLFYDDGSHLGIARGAVPFSQPEVDRWVTTLQARTQVARARDAAYVVLVPPVKERVYPEYAPRWMRDGGNAVDAVRLQRAARERGLDNVVYLLPALRELRERMEPVYSPYDIHWTGIGAYEGYVRLARELERQGVGIEVWPLSRYSLRDTGGNVPRDVALMLGVADFVEHDFPQFEYVPVASRMKVEYLTDRHDWTGARVIDTGQAGKPVLLFTGDSFSNDLLPFLYPHFSRLVVAHNQDGYFRTDLMERYDPDAVVVEILESGVRHAMTPPLDPTGPDARAGAPAAPGSAAAPAPGWVDARPEIVRAAESGGAAACNFEKAERVAEAAGDVLLVEGWMFDQAGRRAAASTLVLLRDAAGRTWTHAVPNGVARPDVAGHFGIPAASGSGFSLRAALPADTRGPWTLALVQPYGATHLRCGSSRELR